VGPPGEVIPETMQTIARELPLTHVVIALQDPWIGRGPNLTDLTIVSAITVVAAFAYHAFREELSARHGGETVASPLPQGELCVFDRRPGGSWTRWLPVMPVFGRDHAVPDVRPGRLICAQWLHDLRIVLLMVLPARSRRAFPARLVADWRDRVVWVSCRRVSRK
jgi:hypothetical protein